MRQFPWGNAVKIASGVMSMRQNAAQLFAAVLLGVVMPAFAMQLGQAAVFADPQPTTQTQTTALDATSSEQTQQHLDQYDQQSNRRYQNTDDNRNV